jgi:hypothetical protein
MDKRDDVDEWQKLEKELMVGLGSRWNMVISTIV